MPTGKKQGSSFPGESRFCTNETCDADGSSQSSSKSRAHANGIRQNLTKKVKILITGFPGCTVVSKNVPIHSTAKLHTLELIRSTLKFYVSTKNAIVPRCVRLIAKEERGDARRSPVGKTNLSLQISQPRTIPGTEGFGIVGRRITRETPSSQQQPPG